MEDNNPHMPQFIKKTPWYAQTEAKEQLAHQRIEKKEGPSISISQAWKPKGTDGKLVTKFRNGACENCGAMTHKRKDCLERPRKIGAKYSKRDFGMDEILQPNSVGRSFDERRDNYATYDTEKHMVLVRQKQKEIEVKELSKKAKRRSSNSSSMSSQNSADSDEKKKAKQFSENFKDKDPRAKTHMTSLRIREHTAKYLYNLDPDSAAYNGKSRTMYENPNKDQPEKKTRFAFTGDDSVKLSGEYLALLSQQEFVQEA